MDKQRLLSIGECMVELAPADGDLLKQGFAGDSFNVAWYARQLLGSEFKVDYFTAVGNDSLSNDLVGFMHQAGIGVGGVRIIPGGKLGLYMIGHDEYGDRIFSYWRDRSAARQLAADPAALRRAIERCGLVHVSGITLAILSPEHRETLLAELRRAKAAGATVSFDPNIRPALWESPHIMQETLTEAARAATIALPGLEEEQACFGTGTAQDVVDRYRALGVETVVVKRGAAGALLHHAGRSISIPAAPAPWIVDTTAAGDSFAGAFLARLMQGETAERAARKASVVSAEVIGHRGALVRVSMAVSDPAGA